MPKTGPGTSSPMRLAHTSPFRPGTAPTQADDTSIPGGFSPLQEDEDFLSVIEAKEEHELQHVVRIPTMLLITLLVLCSTLCIMVGAITYIAIKSQPAIKHSSDALLSLNASLTLTKAKMESINTLMVQTNVLIQQLDRPMEDSDSVLQKSLVVVEQTRDTIDKLTALMDRTNTDAEFLVYNIYAICKIVHPLGGSGCANETQAGKLLLDVMHGSESQQWATQLEGLATRLESAGSSRDSDLEDELLN